MANIEKLSISLPAETVEDIRHSVERGEYATVSEAVRDALRDWKQKRAAERYEALAPKSYAELKRMVQKGIESADRGRMKPAEEVFARLEAKYAAMVEAQGKTASRARKPRR